MANMPSMVKVIRLSSGIFADDFHVFSVEWDNKEIRGLCDDIQYFTADITPAQLSEFHNNFFIILNVAVVETGRDHLMIQPIPTNHGS